MIEIKTNMVKYSFGLQKLKQKWSKKVQIFTLLHKLTSRIMFGKKIFFKKFILSVCVSGF